MSAPLPPTSPILINQRFLEPDDLALLKLYCTTINPGASALHVWGLGRHGKTSARLLLALFDSHGGMPFVVKLANRSDIETEATAIKSVQVFFPDALPGYPPVYTINRGALAYQHLGTTSASAVPATLDLERIAYDRAFSDTAFQNALRALYHERCNVAHEACGLKPLALFSEYKWYLRKTIPRSRIRSVLGSDCTQERLDFLGTRILNPLFAHSQGFRRKLPCMVGPIHGDLHPTNVVLDAHRSPHLIDFAWANKSGHVLKDFVLMENSLRFMLFPRHTNWHLHKKCSLALLEEDGYEHLSTSPFKESDLAWHYRRLGKALAVLRPRARHVSGGAYNFQQYLAAQFLVLFGLLKFDTYPLHCCVRSLGLIASRLKGSAWLP